MATTELIDSITERVKEDKHTEQHLVDGLTIGVFVIFFSALFALNISLGQEDAMNETDGRSGAILIINIVLSLILGFFVGLLHWVGKIAFGINKLEKLLNDLFYVRINSKKLSKNKNVDDFLNQLRVRNINYRKVSRLHMEKK